MLATHRVMLAIPLGSRGNVLDALDTSWMPSILTKRHHFSGSDPPEAAGHSNWYTFSQKDIFVQDSDPPEAAGHSSAWL